MPPHRKRKSAQPRQGEALLDALFRRLKLTDEAKKWRALRAWHEAAPPRIRANARGERLAGATLVLRVKSAAWANDLAFMKAQLLARLRATPGGEAIEDLRFSVGPLDDAPAWEEEPAPAEPESPTVEQPTIDDAEIARALGEIGDRELRSALAELFARARRRDKGD